MHGRPRKATRPSAEEEKASAVKATNLRSLQSQFLHFHHNQIYTKEALELNAKLVESNPEYYTAWNYRKLAVDYNISLLDHSHPDSDALKSLLDEELQIVENALKRNYKSYGAWHHRKWVLSKGHSSTDRELRLLNIFQKQDARNFHSWNYRRFITALRNIPNEQELQFTTDVINDNFSNYSAWHNRSVLLSHLLKERVQGFSSKEDVLVNEYEFVRNAVFTDPDDQSGWFYHLWLMAQTVKLDIPLLVTSWPPQGFDLHVPIDQQRDDRLLPLVRSSESISRTFPVVLYFNEYVRGVTLTTVTIEAEYELNSDLSWRPLSTNMFACAQAWVVYLNYPNEKLHASKSHLIKITVGHSQGITSLSGIDYKHSSCIAFTVSLSSCGSLQSEDQIGRISWSEEKFNLYNANSQNSSPLDSFYKLRMDDDNGLTSSEWPAETIANEIAYYRELLSVSNCKIGKLTLARLLMAHDEMMSCNNSPNSRELYQEVLELYQDLMKLDPTHSQYYKDEYSLVLLKQVTASRESLHGYCRQYSESAPIGVSDFVCLRLNNLSLSRIGSIEQLLWVQMLDLSHNHLQSIEGLEAMQLLSCLNLSYNRLGSFTALEPLRQLKSLKVLNISYNEIGAHKVDITRYLCSSPLSHTVASDWNFEEHANSNPDVTSYWDAYSVFRCLNLREIDILGNVIATDNFKLFLFKLMPGLKWLDGEEQR